MRCKGRLELFEIRHPIQCELMRLYISLVEYQNKGQLRLVQDTAKDASMSQHI